MKSLFKRLQVFYFRHKPYFKVYLQRSTRRAILFAIITFCSLILTGLKDLKGSIWPTIVVAVLTAVMTFCEELLKNEQDRSQRKSRN